MPQVLDCTLRDGGYYTNWDFDPAVVQSYLHGVARLPVSFVEVGYVNDPADGYFGEYYFLTREKLQEIRGILRPDQKLVVMIDGKGYKPERLPGLFRPVADLVDLVRITVAPGALSHGVALARALKAIGLSVGFNVM
jgi:4-hydroxy 2-oxovalerate aldolase